MKALSRDRAFSLTQVTKVAIDLMFFVYIIYSAKLRKYYVGSTNDIDDRLHRHNRGETYFTSRGCPWVLVISFEFPTRSDAIRLERKIKKRGIGRYLQDINFNAADGR